MVVERDNAVGPYPKAGVLKKYPKANANILSLGKCGVDLRFRCLVAWAPSLANATAMGC